MLTKRHQPHHPRGIFANATAIESGSRWTFIRKAPSDGLLSRHTMRTLARCFLLFGLVVVVPRVAAAQATLAGEVKDTTGAVLPGVTVEAASPALIEKVRAAVTDSGGRYRIESLPPGSYTVTFSLT